MFLKNFFKELLVFSRSEQRGIVLLLIIIIILSAVLYLLNFTTTFDKTDFTQFQNDVSRFEAMLKKDSIDNASKRFDFDEAEKKQLVFSPFPFNPNTIADSLWINFGLSEKQAAAIINYKNKGGKFYTKDDVKKMYSINDSLYLLIEPYIAIEPVNKFSTELKKSAVEESISKEEFIVDINNSSAQDLEKLPGIGPSRSSSIVAYRNKLGGFVNKEQLKEVYGITDSVFLTIEKKLNLTGSAWLKVNINTDSPSELKHPYLNYNTAKLITAYHKMHGDFSSVEDLKKLALLNDELYRKLVPYLKAEKSR